MKLRMDCLTLGDWVSLMGWRDGVIVCKLEGRGSGCVWKTTSEVRVKCMGFGYVVVLNGANWGRL